MRYRTTALCALTLLCAASACGQNSNDSDGTGGAAASGGSPGSGGAPAGGSGGTGGSSTGGSGGAATGGDAGSSTGGTGSTDCEFSLATSDISDGMPTVGQVQVDLLDGAPDSATIVYELSDPAPGVLNLGGEAVVDLTENEVPTLLLGLKQESDYVFHMVAERDGETCISPSYALPTTGTLAGAPTDIEVTVEQADAREPGFILTSGGYMGSGAYIIDADGDVVWYTLGPTEPGRIQMDYEGKNMWMMSLNPLSLAGNSGELRYLSMDGLSGEEDIEGFSMAHHDFTVMPGGKVAALVWRLDLNAADPTVNVDPESDLVIRSADGTLATPFKVGSNLYVSERYHANAIHYLPEDDSFTIADRNPNMVLKVSSAGEVQWQVGGSCEDAPAGTDHCIAQDWVVVHGHHLLTDGTLLLFNNNQTANDDPSHVLEYELTTDASSTTAELVKDYEGMHATGILGDVQRLPSGNTLITYSEAGTIVEVDEEWNVVQTLSGSFGYASFRPTLYGPPPRP